jgi:hypothetical protein
MITEVQDARRSTSPFSDNAATVSFSGASGGGTGQLLTVHIFGTRVATSVTDDGGNTWVQADNSPTTGVGDLAGFPLMGWYTLGTNAATTITAHFDEFDGFIGMQIGEFDSDSGAFAYVDAVGNATDDQTSHPTGSLSTTVNDGVFVGSGIGAGDNISPDSNFTSWFNDGTDSSSYRIVTAPTTENMTRTSLGAVDSLQHCMAFQVAAAGRTTKNTRSFPLGRDLGMNRGFTPLTRSVS